MANYMFVLRNTEKRYRVVCPTCFKRGIVDDSCSTCGGAGTYRKMVIQYYVQDKPIHITKVDREPNTGILRYWENNWEFFYETVYPELNKYVPNVPHGIHLCHDCIETAQVECERINKYLINEAKHK